MEYNESNVIETTAPIKFELLKQYFENEDTIYLIDLVESELKGDQLLTYISNLEMPIDIQHKNTPEYRAEISSLFTAYLESDVLVGIQSMEELAIGCLYTMKGMTSGSYENLVEDNFESLQRWERRIDELLVYNMQCANIPKYNEWIETLPVDEDQSLNGINFVGLMKYTPTYSLLGHAKQEHCMNNPTMFNDYIYKGNNLFYHWAHENNPVFLLQQNILEGNITGHEYRRIVADAGKSTFDLSSYESKAISIRARRDELLLLSDNLDDSKEVSTYRQSLRDVTLQDTFPESVVWPIEPIA